MKVLNFIDVFAGAGGLSCGLEMSGMRCVLGVDQDKYAAKTFAKNHLHAETFSGDITKLTKKELLKLTKNKEIHAVVGGPPCQGFSTVGLGKPEDTRNSLFLQFVRIVKATNPSFVVMENVTGLLAKKNEKTLKSILSRFHKMGYQMDVRVLSSQNYGVAEKRRRTIFIGTKINKEVIFPKITHDTVLAKTYRPPVTVGDVLAPIEKAKSVLNHDIEEAKIKNKIEEKRLKRIPEGKGIRYEKDEKMYLTPSLKLGVDWKNLRENRFRQTKYQRLDRSKPGPTIMTHRHSYYHPTEPRYLTQREAAAIQSFPNDFEFVGPVTAQWRQIGNAVPPLMARAIGKALLSMYKKANDKKSKTSAARKSKEKTKIENIRSGAFYYR